MCLNLYNSFRFREKFQRKWKRLLHKSHPSQVNYIAIVSLREEMDSVLAGSTSVSTLKWPVENTDSLTWFWLGVKLRAYALWMKTSLRMGLFSFLHISKSIYEVDIFVWVLLYSTHLSNSWKMFKRWLVWRPLLDQTWDNTITCWNPYKSLNNI